jgi:hypothetical protein
VRDGNIVLLATRCCWSRGSPEDGRAVLLSGSGWDPKVYGKDMVRSACVSRLASTDACAIVHFGVAAVRRVFGRCAISTRLSFVHTLLRPLVYWRMPSFDWCRSSWLTTEKLRLCIQNFSETRREEILRSVRHIYKSHECIAPVYTASVHLRGPLHCPKYVHHGPCANSLLSNIVKWPAMRKLELLGCLLP